MATLTFTYLKDGPVSLYEEARVEPYRQWRAKPPQAAAQTGTVASGTVSFTVPEDISYVLWTGSDFRSGMVSTTKVSTS